MWDWEACSIPTRVAGRLRRHRQKKLPRENLAALEAASLLEFMWAREGRGIVRRIADRTRRGEPLSAVLAETVSAAARRAGAGNGMEGEP
jgi:hypothetical protein